MQVLRAQVLFHLKKVPYVCNGCRKAGSCTLTKVLYSAVRADEQYRSDLSYYRTGIALTKADAMEIQKEILPLFEQGQSVYAAMKSCGSRIPFSVKTMYTYIDSGVFPDIKNIDLPRKVRYRGRKKKKDAEGRRKDNWYRDGRRMEDFERFLADNPSVAIVEMDTVEGPRSERRCLLTLQFLTSSLQLAFLRESNSRESVLAIFDDLKRKLGRDDFRKLFQVILTDNGSEFSDPEHIEIAEDGEMLTNVFYCHPLASWEKGDCENNHTLIRRVIPKGRSLSGLSQEDISRMMDHINSYPRAQYNGRSAYDMFVFLNGEEVAKKLGLERVHPRNVTLKPELI